MQTDIAPFDDYYMVCNEGVYFKIGILEGRILTALQEGKTEQDILEKENLSNDDFLYILSALRENGIIGFAKKERLNILYMKIPLFKVDNLLEKICCWIKKYNCIRVACEFGIMMCIFIGLYSIVKEFQNIFTVDSLKLPIYQYALVYLIHFIIIFFHELGHGFACKYFGGKVGKIGVAFIIFNPAMYCDISDIRMFKNKYKQMLCSAAGFIVNAFFIGVFSICLYFNNINFFRIMIGLNAISILINAIPFVRLDGYWILSFGIGISNLYHKSIKKIKHIGKRKEFQNAKDYFILGYGILNCAIICYCCIRFVTELLQITLKIFSV